MPVYPGAQRSRGSILCHAAPGGSHRPIAEIAVIARDRRDRQSQIPAMSAIPGDSGDLGQNSLQQHGKGSSSGISPLRAIHSLWEPDRGGAPVEMTAPQWISKIGCQTTLVIESRSRG